MPLCDTADAAVCDDANPCTVDFCDPSIGCSYLPVAGCGDVAEQLAAIAGDPDVSTYSGTYFDMQQSGEFVAFKKPGLDGNGVMGAASAAPFLEPVWRRVSGVPSRSPGDGRGLLSQVA